YGFVLLHLGELDRADSVFGVVEARGDTALAARGKGLIAEQRGNLEEALRHYQTVLRVGGQDPQVTLKVATLLMRLHRDDEAIPHLLFLRDLNPLNIPVQKLLAQAYLNNNQPARALIPLGFLAYVTPRDPEPHLMLSRVYMGLRQKARALQEAQRALELATSPEDRRQARENLALLYLNLEEPRKAAEVFAGISPAFLSTEELLLRAQALEESGASRKAVQMLARAYRFRRDPRLAREQARILAQEGKLARALQILDRLKERNPDDPSVRFLRALVLTDMGRGKEALQEYDTLLQQDSLNPTYLNNAGYLMLQLGEDLERAGALIQKALQQQPDVPSYLDSMGWYYFLKGDLVRAKKYLEQALDLGGGDDPEILDHLGDLYERLGEPERAREAWRRALKQASPSMRQRLKAKLRQSTQHEEEQAP
ncbi:MAG: tetratricopeptide repeat protein, partial [Candidatus Hydrothermae bacterium]|nr:tetratricopeptide repeat protein [Candidatus Hydrothermae bacterium]